MIGRYRPILLRVKTAKNLAGGTTIGNRGYNRPLHSPVSRRGEAHSAGEVRLTLMCSVSNIRGVSSFAASPHKFWLSHVHFHLTPVSTIVDRVSADLWQMKPNSDSHTCLIKYSRASDSRSLDSSHAAWHAGMTDSAGTC